MARGQAEPGGDTAAQPARPWWERRPFVAALILIAAVPLLYPPIPPLVDLVGHMGRYRVQIDLGTSPWLRQYYDFDWAAIGNLGVDLLVWPLAKLIGLEPAVKLVVLAIPPVTVAGFLWVAREVHHRLPPTALFALPFAFGHPFMFGFVNFALSMALAFLAFGLWLRLGRLGRLKLRAVLFVPISIVTFFAHTFGWGTLGLLCFSAEAVRQHDRGVPWLRAGFNAALHASVMALPLVFVLAWRSDVQGNMTTDWFNWRLKFSWLISALRDQWRWWDIGSVATTILLVFYAVFSRRLALSRNLAFSGLVLLAAYIVLPWTVFGSAYADMRLMPYLLAVLVLAIRYRGDTDLRSARVLAIAGTAFYLLRIAGNTISLAATSNEQQARLEAVEQVPMGARVATFVGTCLTQWELPRHSHLPSIVIVRRHGFANDQWAIEGTNPLRIVYRAPGRYTADSSQMVREEDCRRTRFWSLNQSLANLPRQHFDYVWLIDPPRYDPRHVAGMQLVWRGQGSILYRINP